MRKGHPLRLTNPNPYKMVGISDPRPSHSTAEEAKGVPAKTTTIFISIKPANNDNITTTAFLRKVNNLFFPLRVAITYKILTGAA